MHDPIDATFAAIGHKTAQVGGAGSVLSWLASSEAGVVLGILIGIVGLGVQFYYRRKQDKREQEEHDAKMRLME